MKKFENRVPCPYPGQSRRSEEKKIRKEEKEEWPSAIFFKRAKRESMTFKSTPAVGVNTSPEGRIFRFSSSLLLFLVSTLPLLLFVSSLLLLTAAGKGLILTLPKQSLGGKNENTSGG